MSAPDWIKYEYLPTFEFDPSLLLSILLITLFTLFFFGVDKLLSFLYTKKKTGLCLLILFLIGMGTLIWFFQVQSSLFPFPPSLFSEKMIYVFNTYTGGLAIYAILNIPYLIYQLIKKKGSKLWTILKIIGGLIISFGLILLVNFTLS